jgi:uncharacterized protein YndB with AHSA1/START domain
MTLGRLQDLDGRWQLEFTRRLPHPPDKVWRALTGNEHLRAWFPAEIHGEWVVGATLRFVFPNGEGPTIEGKVITYDPPSALGYTWGDDGLRFELQPDGDGTALRFLNTFGELGKAARDAAGWHVCLDLLEYDLAGEQPPWNPSERWKEVHRSYVESLGPEASTIGPPESFTDYA